MFVMVFFGVGAVQAADISGVQGATAVLYVMYADAVLSFELEYA